jgi:hypothetical protein
LCRPDISPFSLQRLAEAHPRLEAAFVYELLDQPMIAGAQCGKPEPRTLTPF